MAKKSLSGLGAIALGLGGANLSIYTLSSIVSTQGTAAVLLFIFAFLLTLFTSFGYIELILMFPHKVGGIASAAEKAFRPYSPLITNIAGVGYWFAWFMAASFAAVYAATTIQHFFLPWISINWFATFLIVSVTVLNLFGLKWVQRVAIPLAAVGATAAMATILIPILSGHMNWQEATSYSLITPFPGGFGTLTSLMAGLYLIGWIVPGYETVLCYAGEMENPEKQIPRAMYVTMGLACLYYMVFPFILLGVLDHKAIANDILEDLWPIYVPALGAYAKMGMAWFIVFNLLVCLFPPLAGPPRTLAQLAKDELLPSFLGQTSRLDVPWIATLLTCAFALIVVWLGAPTWLIAATNFQYLICIGTVSIAILLLRVNEPDAIRPYRAPTIFIKLGIVVVFIWTLSAILGFQQYGLRTMIFGISFAFIGIPFYVVRRMQIRREKGYKLLPSSLNIKLTGSMFTVLLIDAIGYLIAVHSINETSSELVLVLEDIFVVVALLTLSAGLIIPGMIVQTAEEVSMATKRLINTNLKELCDAMQALGSGNLSEAIVHEDVIPLAISSRDEIGEMAENFNNMQEELRKTSLSFNNVRDRLRKSIDDLKELNITLEKRVEDRTIKLESTNKNLQNEIAERIQAEVNINLLNDQLVVAARRAGMADIASSILHNIGNVLTSVNTSANLIYEKISNSKLNNLSSIETLLKAHSESLTSFLTTDEKGKMIPDFIVALSNQWSTERANLFEEMIALEKNIGHIRDIITMQQSLSGAIGMTEQISIIELIHDALALNKAAYERAQVEIVHDFKPVNPIVIDRIKLLQIIVNLIKNSIDALVETNVENKKLTLSLIPMDDHFFKFEIIDNGIGIAPENITKIFSARYTSKKGGHGFGLHISSIAAQEMGGSLIAKSDGIGKGATFILTLPYKPLHDNKGIKKHEQNADISR